MGSTGRARRSPSAVTACPSSRPSLEARLAQPPPCTSSVTYQPSHGRFGFDFRCRHVVGETTRGRGCVVHARTVIVSSSGTHVRRRAGGIGPGACAAASPPHGVGGSSASPAVAAPTFNANARRFLLGAIADSTRRSYEELASATSRTASPTHSHPNLITSLPSPPACWLISEPRASSAVAPSRCTTAPSARGSRRRR